MKNYKYILFDLDGTLTDSSEGILNSILYALEKMGIEEKHPEELSCFIGPPLIDSMISRYGLDHSAAEKAVSLYREYFSVKGVYENRLYVGVEDLLRALRDQNKSICLATSKPDKYVDVILRHFSIDEHFDAISAASIEMNILNKTDVLRQLLNNNPAIDKTAAVMIGDRSYDIDGARDNGLPAIAVSWGFGSGAELTKASPMAIVDSMQELKNILL